MQRILVTGAGGFIGRNVLAPLARLGFDVHAVTRSPGGVPDDCRHSLDLRDRRATAELMDKLRPSHLLHLAWTVQPGAFWTTRDNLDWVALSLNLYRSFAAAGGKRMVCAGTCAEYDWNALGPDGALDEFASPCRPATLYGKSKHALHVLLEEAARLDDVALAWGRIFFLYGPGEKAGRLVSSVVNDLLAQREAKTSPGTQLRDFLHVADVAGAFAALCAAEAVGPVNIADGRARPLADLVNLLGELSGRPDLVRLGARPMPAGEPHNLSASVARLREEVGFQPRFDLESGLRDTVEWWRTQLERGQR